MICELCGKETPRTRTVSIEGSVLTVCMGCTRFGSDVAGPIRVRRPGNPVVAERIERRARRMTERAAYPAPATAQLVGARGGRGPPAPPGPRRGGAGGGFGGADPQGRRGRRREADGPRGPCGSAPR